MLVKCRYNVNKKQNTFCKRKYADESSIKNFETNEIDYWWGNFHQTFEGMQQGNEAWEEPEAMNARSALEEVSTCGNPDLYNSQTIYDPLNPKLS